MPIFLRALILGLVVSMACTGAGAETATKDKVLAAIPKLEKLAKAAVANGGVPGLAIAIVYQDEVVYLGGFGVREEVTEEKLYKPLGMSSTSSRYADFLTHENRAEQHVPVDGKWTALVKRDPDPQAPAGGSSNARDGRRPVSKGED
jgi:CubicO group peptidase (beta-lactamase class C family)